MKKRNLLLMITITLAFLQPAYAADGHGGGATHDMAGHSKAMEDAGETVNGATVEGYRLTYQLIDNLANLAAAKQAGKAADIDPAKVKSHHLMLHIVAADGAQVADAKVGFLVKGPDGVEQTVMTMPMAGGYGADIDLRTPGSYTIKSKAALGAKILIDQFTYTRQ